MTAKRIQKFKAKSITNQYEERSTMAKEFI